MHVWGRRDWRADPGAARPRRQPAAHAFPRPPTHCRYEPLQVQPCGTPGHADTFCAGPPTGGTLLVDACPGNRGARWPAACVRRWRRGHPGRSARNAPWRVAAGGACRPSQRSQRVWRRPRPAGTPNVPPYAACLPRLLPAAGAPVVYSGPGKGDYLVGLASGAGCEREQGAKPQALIVNLAQKVGRLGGGGTGGRVVRWAGAAGHDGGARGLQPGAGAGATSWRAPPRQQAAAAKAGPGPPALRPPAPFLHRPAPLALARSAPSTSWWSGCSAGRARRTPRRRKPPPTEWTPTSSASRSEPSATCEQSAEGDEVCASSVSAGTRPRRHPAAHAPSLPHSLAHSPTLRRYSYPTCAAAGDAQR